MVRFIRITLYILLMTSTHLAVANIEIVNLANQSRADVELKEKTIVRVDKIKATREVRMEGGEQKVHYYMESGELLASVKRKPDSITVKMFGGHHLWNVKLKDYGLLVTNNVEMSKPYKITKKKGLYLLRRGDEKIAKVKEKDGKIKVMVAGKNKFVIWNGKPKYSALLAIPEMEFVFAVVLFAELMLE